MSISKMDMNFYKNSRALTAIDNNTNLKKKRDKCMVNGGNPFSSFTSLYKKYKFIKKDKLKALNR